MRPAPPLGEFEQIVLLTLLRLGADAYGASVSLEIEQQTGRIVSVSAVHTTLDRLEEKGFVRSRLGDPTPQRGGKRKRHYVVLPSGVRAVQHAVRTLRRLADGLDDLLGETR
jgi:PadR family transcriptional regulator, regulatory protein PadR